VSDELCRKPGCGALKGRCADWDCPEGHFVKWYNGQPYEQPSQSDTRAPAGAQERCGWKDPESNRICTRPPHGDGAHWCDFFGRPAPEFTPLAPQPQPDRAALDIAVAALEDIADMRAYDQDDAHRLRHKAVATLVRLKLREPDRSQLSAFPAPGVYTQEQAERRCQSREEPPYEGHSPNGRCAQCGAYVWVEMGFCGVCHPERL
jgi:hypothetical protein